ncbi:hypothetical protein EGW08_006294, partial [Elysia chlorotica]
FQYGKNFEAISKKISQSAKVRGFAPKDKVQVQYFYYRNWRKIAKFVDMKETDVPMKTQELYGLINYGVLQKYVKGKSCDLRNVLKYLLNSFVKCFILQENTNNTLRTPICTCLKKINRLIDANSSQSTSSQKLPQTISIELTPKNSKAWAKVQSVSQNPRLRMKVPPSRTVESVIKFLNKKWKPQRTKSKEKLGVVEESRENLVMFLHPNTKIFPVNLIARQNEKVDVSFTNYRQSVLPMLQSEKKSQAPKGSDKVVGVEKEKDKPSFESIHEQIFTGGGILSFSDSSHSQKSEEKLSLFIPENKCQDGGNFLQGVVSSPSDAEFYPGKMLQCTSPSHCAAKDRAIKSPKALHPASALLVDDNAMFPDSSEPFSPSSVSSSSSLQQSKLQVETCLSPLVQNQQVSPGLPDVTSPSVGRKKRIGGRVTKKASSATDGAVCLTGDAGSVGLAIETNSTLSTSPAKQQDCPGPPASGSQDQSPHKDSQAEIARLTRLATEEGFTALNSHTVTLLHLSLLLGRETLVRLQYEWREKRPARGAVQGPVCATVVSGSGGAILGQAAAQMSNLLRRLCNLATLELTDFVRDSELKTSKSSGSSGCSRCFAQSASAMLSSSVALTSASAKANSTRTRRQSLLNQTERGQGQNEADVTSTSAILTTTKDTGVQTDPPPAAPIQFPFTAGLPASTIHLAQAPGAPATVRLPDNVQVLQQGSVMTTGGRTFVAGTPAPAGTQINGRDQVFRVPLIPTFRDAARAEQMKQEHQRRLQETAKTILEQGSNQPKLLKRRRVISKKKAPPVIVQRTLMPKLDAGEVVTYIQQPALTPVSSAMLYSLNPAEAVSPQTGVSSQTVPVSTHNNLMPSLGLSSQAA